MKFKFRLERYCVFATLRKSKTRRFLQRQRELQEAVSYLDSLKLKKKEVAQFGYAQSDLELRTAAYRYMEHLDEKIEQQTKVVAQCQTRLMEARDAWMKAKQKVELLEKLRERRLAEFRLEQDRAEQKLLDDMGTRARA